MEKKRTNQVERKSREMKDDGGEGRTNGKRNGWRWRRGKVEWENSARPSPLINPPTTINHFPLPLSPANISPSPVAGLLLLQQVSPSIPSPPPRHSPIRPSLSSPSTASNGRPGRGCPGLALLFSLQLL